MNPRPMTYVVKTARLGLRAWRAEDRAAFAAMNADPRVMQFYPRPLRRSESDESADRLVAHIARCGFGLWTAELLDGGGYVGFIGLQNVPFEASFTPAIELGWRLRTSMWGRGLATEGARGAAAFAFNELGVDEIVAMARADNLPSVRVMQRLGMTHDPSDDFELQGPFDEPHAFALYRLRRQP